ncbi:hypothetical protein JAAARDRAFT_35923 [Jaapia argillacea MUCL 33604]|uniref:Uncharacterized protein n=1 Tax=Jaapia argillacea MUCL 33604 TaxID=933084 RepID=A0A067Q3X4_9AGAM|nr:hypothetical protein JAAARDRAFT_35923 [Jaapia argillacea MUCL 33604]
MTAKSTHLLHRFGIRFRCEMVYKGLSSAHSPFPIPHSYSHPLQSLHFSTMPVTPVTAPDSGPTQHRAIVTLPKNTIAFIFGTATSGVKQQVEVKLRSEGTDLQDCTFEGLNTPLEVTQGGSGIAHQTTIVINPDSTRERELQLVFRSYGRDGYLRDIVQLDTNVNKPIPWVTNYTYNTEDGGDHDVHDTTLVVSVINTTK